MNNAQIPENEKLTFSQVQDIIQKYHKEHNIYYVSNRDDCPYLKFRIVFDPTESGWRVYQNKIDDNGVIIRDNNGKPVPDKTKPLTYTIESCTYEINDCDEFWFSECCGNSLYAFCIDKHEPDCNGIRLDCYLKSWKILYCYQVKNGKEK